MSAKTPLQLLIFTLFFAITFYCLDYFIRMSSGVVANELMQQYGLSALGFGSMVAAFYWGYLLFQIPAGILLTKQPLQWVLVITISLTSLSFLAFIYLHNAYFAYLLRFIIGVASSFSFISILFIANNFLPSRYFNLICGIAIGAGTVAGSLVQVVVAYLNLLVSWHVSFLSVGLLGLFVALLLSLPYFKFLNKADQFVPVNSIPLKNQLRFLITNRAVWLNGITGGLFYLPTSILSAAWGITLLETSYHLTRPIAAQGILLLFLGWAIGSPILGAVSDRVKQFNFTILYFAAAALLVSLGLIYLPTFFHAVPLLLMFLFGLFSSAQVMVWKYFSHICPKEISGIGIAVTNMIIMLGSALFHILVGWVINWHSNQGQLISAQNLMHSLWIIPFAFGLTMLCSVGLRIK